MVFSALHIPTNTVVEIFDDLKQSKEEYNYFVSKYPPSKGFCIASKKEQGN